MSLTAILALAVQSAPAIPVDAAPRRVVAVQGTATAEIVRAGRSGDAAGPEDVAPQRRRTTSGAVLSEFR